MKKSLIIGLMVFLAFGVSRGFAQSRNFSFGIITTQFHNNDGDARISEIDNPVGVGAIVGYQINSRVGVGFTAEYFSDDMQNLAGTEKDYRGNLSFFIFPVQFNRLHPYISAGTIYTHRKQNFDDGRSRSKNWIDARMGTGLDINLFRNVNLNTDVGVYSDGLNVVGWGGSIGLRFALR